MRPAKKSRVLTTIERSISSLANRRLESTAAGMLSDAKDLIESAEKDLLEAKREKLIEWVAQAGRDHAGELLELYDLVYRIPTVKDIMETAAPQRDKQLMLEKLDQFDYIPQGTHEYHELKKDLWATIHAYRNIQNRDIYEVINMIYDKPTIADVINANLPIQTKYNLAIKLEMLKTEPFGSESYWKIKHDILTKLKGTDSSLKEQVVKSDLSAENKTAVMLKVEVLERMNPYDSSYSKLHEWIDRALMISDYTLDIYQDNKNSYLKTVKEYLDQHLYGMTQAKERLLELLALRLTNPQTKDTALGLVGPPGVGKCLHPDTQILLYFGGMKAAKNIVRGDILIGDDSNPRIVMQTTTGTDKMYKITPEFSDPYIVNEPHVLSLYNPSIKQVKDIPLNEFLQKSIYSQKKYKMFSVPIEYPISAPTKNDPFLIGLLLGSQEKTSKIIETVLKEYLTIRLNKLYKSVKAESSLRKLDSIDKDELRYILDHQYIPDVYLYTSRSNRHKLLMGLVEAEAKKAEASLRNSSGKSQRSASAVSIRELSRPSSAKSNMSRYSGRSGSYTDLRTLTPKSAQPNSAKSGISFPATPKSAQLNSAKNNSQTPKSTAPASTVGALQAASTAQASAMPKPILKNTTAQASTIKFEPVRKSRLEAFKSKIPVLKTKELKITNQNNILLDQITFVIRSLGFKCLKTKNEIDIYDDIQKLPDMDHLTELDFTIEPHDSNKYAGFTLDGNGRFLLSSCLVTHNTHLVQVFADAIGLPFAKINMGGAVDSHYFLGHSYTYEGSTPGVIVKTLSDMKNKQGRRTKTGVILLDEFDKIGHNSKIAHTFLHISDPVQQADFRDQYMPEMKIDLSNITFVYSMNDISSIDATLLNRIPIIHVQGYNSKEKKAIMEKYLLPNLIKNTGLPPNSITISDEVFNMLDGDSSSGMRNIKHQLSAIVNRINALNCAPQGVWSYTIPGFSLPICITKKIYQSLKIESKPAELNLSLYI